jgi:DNA-directed RNA polymerase specialized sigma24 family protein
MEPEEARLLACLAANLDAHFAELVTAYQHRLYVFVLRQTGSVQDAEDIVQETFLQEEQPESLFESQEARQELEACVARLPVHYREAINLYYFEGLTYQEISDLLEQPMGTIKSYLHRGVRLLRKLAAETSEKGVR